MQITVSARHDTTLDPAHNERAHDILNRLVRFDDQFLEATVVFEQTAGRSRVEARLRGTVSGTLAATADAEDFRTALDIIEQKLRRQIERNRRHFSVRPQVNA